MKVFWHFHGVDNWYTLRENCPFWSYFGPHFPAFGLNTDQNISEYGHFLLSDIGLKLVNAECAYFHIQ